MTHLLDMKKMEWKQITPETFSPREKYPVQGGLEKETPPTSKKIKKNLKFVKWAAGVVRAERCGLGLCAGVGCRKRAGFAGEKASKTCLFKT